MVSTFFVEQLGQRPKPHLPDARDEPRHFPNPGDDSQWDVFVPDDDEIDPLPEPGDFWIEPEEERDDVGAASRAARRTRVGLGSTDLH
jgi:hypothetical protein